MSAFTLTIDIPPGLWLTSNQRLHWAARAERTRRLRHLARTTARRERVPRHEVRVRVTVTIHPRVRGRMDPLNVAPTVKALVDGLTDAGVWADDDHTHLVGPDIRAGDPDPTQPIGWHRLSVAIAEENQP